MDEDKARFLAKYERLDEADKEKALYYALSLLQAEQRERKQDPAKYAKERLGLTVIKGGVDR